MKLNKKGFDLPYLTIGRLARILNLTPDTIFWLCKKGCFGSERREGKMVFARKEILRWLRETGCDNNASKLS